LGELPKGTCEGWQVKFFIILSRIPDFNVEAQNEKNGAFDLGILSMGFWEIPKNRHLGSHEITS
jgi:hypothetical protein